MREHFHGLLLELVCRQENCAERRRMEEDLPARWDPTAALSGQGTITSPGCPHPDVGAGVGDLLPQNPHLAKGV